MKLREIASEPVFEDTPGTGSCHASTLVELPEGDVVAAWFAGSWEGKGDVAIRLSIRRDGAWTDPVTVADEPDVPHWNPVLALTEGTVHLFYRVGPHPREWVTYVKRSADGGNTWGERERLSDGMLGPIKNKPIRMSNGSWLCGSSDEAEGRWFCVMETWHPHGNSWRRSEPLRIEAPENHRGIIQPTLWESSPGKLHALMRSDCGWIYRADSGDFGRTWNAPVRTELVNPHCGIDLVRLADGTLVLIHNPTTLRDDGSNGPRSPLVMSTSIDNGMTWTQTLTLEDEPDQRFSYPGVIPTSDGFAMVYTWKRKRIAYRRFAVS